MKKVLFVFLSVFVLMSCNQDEDILQLGDSTPIQDPEVALRSSSASGPSYETSIRVYKYYWGDWSSGVGNSDMYFGTEEPSSRTLGTIKTIHGRDYSYQFNEFNVTNTFNSNTTPLFRHYNEANKDHILSTTSPDFDCVNESMIGYIFTTQQPGTVPLKEYYSSVERNHTYVILDREVEYMRIHAPSFVYQGIVGYVYPGERSEIDGKKHQTITINNTSFRCSMLTATVDVLEELKPGVVTSKTLTYYLNSTGIDQRTIELGGPYTICRIKISAMWYVFENMYCVSDEIVPAPSRVEFDMCACSDFILKLEYSYIDNNYDIKIYDLITGYLLD